MGQQNDPDGVENIERGVVHIEQGFQTLLLSCGPSSALAAATMTVGMTKGNNVNALINDLPRKV